MIRHPVPIVAQQDDHDCGPACIEAVALYAGLLVDGASLVSACRTTYAHGTDPEDLVAVLEGGGLVPRIEEPMTPEELRDALERGPVICAIQAYGTGHWVVAVNATTTRVTVMDPASSQRCYRWMYWPEWVARWHDTDRRGRPRVQCGIGVRARAKACRPMRGIPA